MKSFSHPQNLPLASPARGTVDGRLRHGWSHVFREPLLCNFQRNSGLMPMTAPLWRVWWTFFVGSP